MTWRKPKPASGRAWFLPERGMRELEARNRIGLAQVHMRRKQFERSRRGTACLPVDHFFRENFPNSIGRLIASRRSVPARGQSRRCPVPLQTRNSGFGGNAQARRPESATEFFDPTLRPLPGAGLGDDSVSKGPARRSGLGGSRQIDDTQGTAGRTRGSFARLPWSVRRCRRAARNSPCLKPIRLSSSIFPLARSFSYSEPVVTESRPPPLRFPPPNWTS